MQYFDCNIIYLLLAIWLQHVSGILVDIVETVYWNYACCVHTVDKVWAFGGMVCVKHKRNYFNGSKLKCRSVTRSSIALFSVKLVTPHLVAHTWSNALLPCYITDICTLMTNIFQRPKIKCHLRFCCLDISGTALKTMELKPTPEKLIKSPEESRGMTRKKGGGQKAK